MLGYTQTEFYKNAFSTKIWGLFNNVKVITIITTNPVFTMSKSSLNALASYFPDVKEYLAYKFEAQLIQFLDIVRVWKEAKADRQIVFVGGDLHLAGHTQIFYNKKPFARQLVASGINQFKLKKYEVLLSRSAFYFNHEMEGNYSFAHHNWIGAKNYGTVNYKNLSADIMDIDMYVTVSNSIGKIAQLKTFNNIVFDANQSLLKLSALVLGFIVMLLI